MMALYLTKQGSAGGSNSMNSMSSQAGTVGSDFSYLDQDGENGSTHMHLPLQLDESFGTDLSMKEAVQKLQELMKENYELKNTLKDNNLVLKSLQTILMDMKDKWSNEQQESMKKFEQAKTVVFNLRRDLENARMKLKKYENVNSEEQTIVKDVQTNDSEKLQNDIKQLNAILVNAERERSQQRKEIDNLRSIARQAQKNAEQLASELEEKKQSFEELDADMKHKEEQMCQLTQQNKKLAAARNSAEKEKMQVEALNHKLREQLEIFKDRKTINEDNSAELKRIQMIELGEKVSEIELENKTSGASRDHSDLLEKLENEQQLVEKFRAQNEQLQADLAQSTRELEHRTTQLNLTQDAMDGRMREIESLHIQKESELIQQLGALQRQLQHSLGYQGHMNESPDILKAQVLSLLNELQESNSKHREIIMMNERYRQKCEELELQYKSVQEQLGSLRSRDDQLIEALRTTVADTERALASQKQKNEEKRAIMEDYQCKVLEQQKEINTLKYKLDEVRSQSPSHTPGGGIMVSIADKREQDEKLGQLTAQLLQAEDSIMQKQEEIQKLQQKVMILRTEGEDIPYLKAQIDSYKVDFEAERKARKQERQMLANLREELETMRLCNRQLHDQLDKLTALHRQCSYSSGHVSSSSRMSDQRSLPRSRQHNGGGFDECDDSGKSSMSDYQNPGRATPPASAQAYIRQPSEHAIDYKEEVSVHRMQLTQDYECPGCGLKTQDIDSLTIHVDDCVKDSKA